VEEAKAFDFDGTITALDEVLGLLNDHKRNSVPSELKGVLAQFEAEARELSIHVKIVREEVTT
jgi:hypothetical protein